MSLSAALLDSPLRQAERALRRPSSAVWLCGVRIRTRHFDEALAFYVSALGLTLGSVEVHPTRAQASARLLDAEGSAVLELVDDEVAPAGAHEVSFAMPRRTVTLLRARLGGLGVACDERGGTLVFRDPDGGRIRVQSLP